MHMKTSNTAAKILSILFSGRRRRFIEQLAGEAARDCRGRLWRIICRQTREMSPPEIRGYARAIAADLLEEHVEHVLERHDADAALRASVITAGVEQLVATAVRDALSDPMWEAERIAA